MKSLADAQRRDEIVERVRHLTRDAQPQWGGMSAGQMLAHLVQSLRMASGELPAKSKKLPLRYWPLKQLAIYLLPFPKGAPTAPELLRGDAEAWDTNRDLVKSLLDKLGARDPSAAWPEHPAFGTLSGKQWFILGYRHMDHHLRQFGV